MCERQNPAHVVTELTDKRVRDNIDLGDRLKFIGMKITIVPLDEETAEAVGRIIVDGRREIKRRGLTDSCTTATARSRGARVVTGDEHFNDLKDYIRI